MYLDRHGYREFARRSSPEMMDIGVRMLSSDAADALVEAGTSGQLGWKELRDFLHDPSHNRLPSAWKVNYLLDAAFLRYMIEQSDDHLALAVRLVQLSLSHEGFESAMRQSRTRLYAAQIAYLSGDAALREKVLKRTPNTVNRMNGSVAWAVRTDLLLPNSWVENDERVTTWWDTFNEPLAEAGLEDWIIRPEEISIGRSVFSCIHAPRLRTCEVPVEDQPLVSIIVPTYCPGQSFLNTIESLVHQSWKNLEIIIVDDASPSGHDYITAAVASDQRIRYERMEENGGAYKARNRGIRLSRGEFATVVDSDDQSHPRKIERQMLPLLARPSLMATMCVAIRVFDDGSLMRLGQYPLGSHTPSLLYRKQQAIEALGYYDEVRKAADTEYVERLMHRFGKNAILHVKEPLDLYQLTSGSLSRNDFRAGWFDDRRVAYRHQWKSWHQHVLQSPDDDHSPAQPDGRRAFVTPPSFVRQPEIERVEVAYLTDWATSIEKQERPAEIISSLIGYGSGGPIGLLHGIHPRLTPKQREFTVTKQLWDVVEAGDAEWVSWDQKLHIDTLIVADPEYLVYIPDEAHRTLTFGSVVILAESTMELADGRIALLGPDWADRLCLDAFGVAPHWLPASGSIAELITPAAANVLPPTPLRDGDAGSRGSTQIRSRLREALATLGPEVDPMADTNGAER